MPAVAAGAARDLRIVSAVMYAALVTLLAFLNLAMSARMVGPLGGLCMSAATAV